MTRFENELTKPVNQLLVQAQQAADKLEQRKTLLTQDMSVDELVAQLQLLEEISEHLISANCLSDAAFSVDQENEDKSALLNKTTQVSSKIYQQTIYFTLTLQEHNKLDEYIKKLPRYKTFLRRLKEQQKHSLKEEQEQLISKKDENGSNKLIKIYDMITANYVFEIELEGKTKKCTRAEIQKLMTDENRSTRKKAKDSFYEQFGPDKHVLNEIYTALVADRVQEQEMRGYSTAIEARHQSNDITQEVYEALQNSADKHNKLFQEYIECKRQVLGYKEMRGYDINANIPGLPKGLNYQEATKHMIDVFANYADWMAQLATQIHQSKRVDAESRQHKRSGACSYETPPSEQPLIILNHQDDFNSLKTLAHETGHAIHNILTKNNSVLVANPPIVLAETASNLAELLIIEDARAHANKKEEIALLCDFLADAFGSISMQILYTKYEKWVHDNPESTLSQRCYYWKQLQENLLPNVKRTTSKDYGWISIPHLYQLPFYCYGYSFGILLAMALYKQATPQEIKEILEAGGSKKPHKLLSTYGYDITSEDFWDQGFMQLQLLVDRLNTLL